MTFTGDDKQDIKTTVIESGHPEYAGEILDFVRRKDGIRYAEKRLNDYIESAKKSVSRLPASQSRDYLEGMTEYVAKRRI